MSDATDLTSQSDVNHRTDSGGRSELREPTDVHRTKIPPDDPRLHIDRPRSRTLKRGAALVAVGVVAALGGIALAVAFNPSTSPPDSKPPTQATEVSSSAVTLPDVIRDPPGHPDIPRDAGASSSPGSFRPQADAAPPQQNEARTEEIVKARGSGLFAKLDDPIAGETPPPHAAVPTPSATGPQPGTATPPTTQASDSGRALDPNMQERKNDFLSKTGSSSSEYLARALTPPMSPYEVKAGTVIPTVLITGINSDLPGQVVGQVRENVYDSVSGNYLLIPQGSRLIAGYDSMVAWGQERVLVCWNRLIRPDGSSVTLDCMPGVDLSGYSGFADDVDNHWWKIISGAALSSLLAATAQRSQGDVTGFQPSLPQAWAGNTAGQINQAGQQLTQKNLQIQPTITIRPGFAVNVLVTKDMIIPPYRQPGLSP
jgi:type IV secretory pathway VirB10-like protein